MPRLIDEWHKELTRLWSVRLALVSAALSGFYAAWPAFQYSLPPWLFAMISSVLCMAVVGARIIRQEKKSQPYGNATQA